MILWDVNNPLSTVYGLVQTSIFWSFCRINDVLIYYMRSYKEISQDSLLVTPDLKMLWLVDNSEYVASGLPLEMLVEELLVMVVEELLVMAVEELLVRTQLQPPR